MSYWEALGQSNDWYTPPEIFEALGETFDLDPCHPRTRTHVPTHFWFKELGLEYDWHGFVWMNPPFEGRNGIEPWLTKFFDHGNGIALTPDRTSAPWFRKAWRSGSLVLFTKKIKFLRPDGSRGASPSNGTALWAAGERAELALRRGAAKGLGILAQVDRSPEGQDNADWPDRDDESAVLGEDAPTPCGPSDNLSGDGW